MKSVFLTIALALVSFTSQACEVQVNPLGSLRYNALSSQPSVALMNVDVLCPISTSVRLQASKGQSPTYLQRQMGMGIRALGYNLFLGTNDAFVWGDGTMGTSEGSAVVDGSYRFVGNIRIPPNQNPPVGMYSDTLIFTVIF